MSLALLIHAATGATTQLPSLPSLDAKCTGTSKYVSSSTYSARVSTWGQVGRGGWRGAVLGPNQKIYGIPTNATSVLELDPVTRKVRTFGDLGTALTPANCSGALHCGLDKWIGGVLAPNGKIIGIPCALQTSASPLSTSLAEPSLPTRCVADAAESVLEIDPLTHEVSTFGVISSSVKRKWVEGVLARNGKIYAIVRSTPLEHSPTPAAAEPTPRMIPGVQLAQPYDAPTILEIDPVTHALETFGNVGKEPCKWYGGVLAPNDKIYAIPYASQFVMEISPESKTAAIFATVGPGWGKWSGGVLAGNGKIYGIPALATSLLEIDVNSRMVTPYGMLPGGEQFQDKWNGGVLAPNGARKPRAALSCVAQQCFTGCLPPAQATSTASHGAAAPSSSSIRRPRPSVSSGSSPQPTSPGASKPSISVRCPSSCSPSDSSPALAAGTAVCASATVASSLSRTTRRRSWRSVSGCACPRMPRATRPPRCCSRPPRCRNPSARC